MKKAACAAAPAAFSETPTKAPAPVAFMLIPASAAASPTSRAIAPRIDDASPPSTIRILKI
ncbi:MAG TPA: hypothetical protein VGF59_34900 [Bryobacteraceae bacterium]|jgi:hypothetical protein